MTSNSAQPQEQAEGTTETSPQRNATEAHHARITRLKINRFRNVKPGTELRFDDGINALLGRNGTGKTTLLELICALARGNLRAYQHESFDLEFDIRLASYCFTASAHNMSSVAHALAGLGPREQPQSWKFRSDLHGASGRVAMVEATPQGAKITLGGREGEETTIDEASLFDVVFYAVPLLQRWTSNAPHVGSVVSNLFSVYRNCLRLDEGLDVFRSIVDGTDLPGMGALTIGRSSHEGAIEFAWYAPFELVAHINAQDLSLHEATDIAVDQASFAVLDAVTKAIDAKTIRCSFMLLDRKQDAETGTVVSRFGKPSFWITTHRGTTFTHDRLSYGEKRLLAFMYHAAANPQILVADELVNGLHHGWIQACLDAIQGQAFLTSQNPLLLDHLPFSSAEEVQRRFILCDRDEHGDWIWRNMDQDAADAFYRAYEVGIQHVSEILETKGLW